MSLPKGLPPHAFATLGGIRIQARPSRSKDRSSAANPVATILNAMSWPLAARSLPVDCDKLLEDAGAFSPTGTTEIAGSDDIGFLPSPPAICVRPPEIFT